MALILVALNIARTRYFSSRLSSSFQIKSPLQMRVRSESERQKLAMTRSDWFRLYPEVT